MILDTAFFWVLSYHHIIIPVSRCVYVEGSGVLSFAGKLHAFRLHLRRSRIHRSLPMRVTAVLRLMDLRRVQRQFHRSPSPEVADSSRGQL